MLENGTFDTDIVLEIRPKDLFDDHMKTTVIGSIIGQPGLVPADSVAEGSGPEGQLVQRGAVGQVPLGSEDQATSEAALCCSSVKRIIVARNCAPKLCPNPWLLSTNTVPYGEHRDTAFGRQVVEQSAERRFGTSRCGSTKPLSKRASSSASARV